MHDQIFNNLKYRILVDDCVVRLELITIICLSCGVFMKDCACELY